MKPQLDSSFAKELRNVMVEDQLKFRGIQHAGILDAFKTVPRHLFIPHVDLEAAYEDHPIPIQAGQTISQPYIVALMLMYLEPQKNHKVLEIGSGSGYATALLSKLCQHIDAVEVYGDLINASRQVIETLELSNVISFTGVPGNN